MSYERRKKRFGNRTRRTIWEYDDDEVLELLRMMVIENQIRNLTDFVNQMKSVKFPRLPEDFQPGLGTANYLRSKVAQYQMAFLNRYDYIVGYAEPEYVAPLEMKKHNIGLVTIFVQGVPFEVGVRLLETIPASDMKACRKELCRFFDVFDEKISEIVDKAKGGMDALDILKGPRATRDDFRSPYNQREEPASNNSIKHRGDRDPEFDISDVYEDYESEVTYENSSDQMTYIPDKFASRSDRGQSMEPKKLFDPRAKKPARPGVQSPGGCLDHVYGRCVKGDACTWQHGPTQLLRDTCDHFVVKLIKTPYAKNYVEAKVLYERAEKEKAAEASEPAQLKTLKHIVERKGKSVSWDTSGVDEQLLDDPELADQMLSAVMPRRQQELRVHRQGEIRLIDGSVIPLQKVLFDSGALHASYISSKLVEEHREELRGNLFPCFGDVMLGDRKTVKTVEEELRIPVAFRDNAGVEHIAEPMRLCVWDMPGLDMIVGLPHILNNFMQLFIEMIKGGEHAGQSLSSIDTGTPVPYALEPGAMQEGVINPWSQEPDEIAPEELATEDPCSFTEPLYYLTVSHEQAVRDYKDLQSKHVEPGLAAYNDGEIIKLLDSLEALEVFVPKEWHGISGFEPVEFEFLDTMPTRMTPRAHPVNPRLYEAAEKEFRRCREYLYEYSKSPIASPLVVAPKATSPYIRLCGDYRAVNPYIAVHHYPIPKVQQALEKAQGYRIKLDIDMTNSFHQFRLGPNTRQKLSVQTPWGQVEPKFLPEGVAPASLILQEHVMSIFAEGQDFMVTIFDNLLVLCHDYADAVTKLKWVIKKAREHNMVLKFSKTWLGFETVTFFGYEVGYNVYGMSQERKDQISAIPMPTSQKSMQRFLGAVLFFKSFVPMFSQATSALYEMTRDGFDWNPKTWTKPYVEEFEALKGILQATTQIHFPDYSLNWTLRVDASDEAVGAALLQEVVGEDGVRVYQPLGFTSQKFSGAASRWDMFKKEAYAVYAGVKSFEYYLRGKFFILETDHKNLLWIEKSIVPIVIRWRVYLQSFMFMMRHIAGKDNVVADWLSRMHFLEEGPEGIEPAPELERAPIEPGEHQSPESLLEQVHGGRNLHRGARGTWMALNRNFPGHRIPFRFVAEWVSQCPRCQKDRLGMTNNLEPIVRHLKPPHHRARIGVDRLTVTPADEEGNCNLIVLVEHYTKYVSAYPAVEYTALTLATALFRHFCTFGVFDEIWSDPGSDLMSGVVQQLNQWFGIRHVVSLVDRHESNGVEGSNKQIIRHLTALVHDTRSEKRWSSPTLLSLILFAVNDAVNSETGVRPMDAKFGSEAGTYFRLPDNAAPEELTYEFLRNLNTDLARVRQISSQVQREIVAERTASNPAPEYQNQYQAGDLILYQYPTDRPKPTKLSSAYLGPYEVIQQRSNDVEARHLCMKNIATFHVSKIKLFVGSRESAFELAQTDADQYLILEIRSYIGDPGKRTTCEFEVAFADGSVVWRVWDQDLFATVPYEQFCRRRRELFPLLFTGEESRVQIKAIRSQDITMVQPGDVAYMDVRLFNPYWYEGLDINDRYEVLYVVAITYVQWSNPRNHRHISAHIPVFDQRYAKLDNYFVTFYGSTRERPEPSQLVDAAYLRQHPSLKPPPEVLAKLPRKP